MMRRFSADPGVAATKEGCWPADDLPKRPDSTSGPVTPGWARVTQGAAGTAGTAHTGDNPAQWEQVTQELALGRSGASDPAATLIWHWAGEVRQTQLPLSSGAGQVRCVRPSCHFHLALGR